MNLKGNDALNKANNLMESMMVQSKVDSFSNIESIHLGYDGKYYGIVKENNNYVLKISEKNNPIVAEDFEYINGVQNKSKYSKQSYNDISKQFNLINIENKRVFGESLYLNILEEQKSVLKIKKKTEPTIDFNTDDSIEPVKDENPEDFNNSSDEDINLEDSDTNDSENPEDFADVDPDDLGTDDPEKMIQKLSGKLAYELREFDDEEKYSDTAKFAMSMTTSALDTSKISDEDKNSIENKVSSKLDSSSDVEESSDNDISNDNMNESLILDKKLFIKLFNEAYSEYNNSLDDNQEILFDIDNNLQDVEKHILFDEDFGSPNENMESQNDYITFHSPYDDLDSDYGFHTDIDNDYEEYDFDDFHDYDTPDEETNLEEVKEIKEKPRNPFKYKS